MAALLLKPQFLGKELATGTVAIVAACGTTFELNPVLLLLSWGALPPMMRTLAHAQCYIRKHRPPNAAHASHICAVALATCRECVDYRHKKWEEARNRWVLENTRADLLYRECNATLSMPCAAT